MPISPTTRVHAERLLAALQKDPGLLYLVAQGLHADTKHIRVVGPWEQPTMGSRERRDYRDTRLAMVSRDSDRALPWSASLAKEVGNWDGMRIQKGFPTEGEALRWVDKQLLAAGYLLTTEIGAV